MSRNSINVGTRRGVDLQALNSFLKEESEVPQMTALHDFLSRQTLKHEPLILVTLANIGALAGTYRTQVASS